MVKAIDKSKVIRNAATVILVRNHPTSPSVLMGQRGENAAFMPNKFVFPGGAVDPLDCDFDIGCGFDNICLTRLRAQCDKDLSNALAAAAVREVFEETGLVIGKPDKWTGQIPEDWAEFAALGYVPDATKMRFVFRAITPPGRPRRFDARFFLVNADLLDIDLDDFSRASDELSHLQWVPLDRVRSFDLPFITEVVLAELTALDDLSAAPARIPFFKNDDNTSQFRYID